MNSITLWYKVKTLQKLSDANFKEFKKAEKKAIEDNVSQERLAYISHGYRADNQDYNDEIMELNTRYLYSKSQKLLLPVPDYSDNTIWEQSHISGRHNLTNKGVTQLRSAIRKELHERRIGALSWVAALTGVIGALSGLIAIIGKSF